MCDAYILTTPHEPHGRGIVQLLFINSMSSCSPKGIDATAWEGELFAFGAAAAATTTTATELLPLLLLLLEADGLILPILAVTSWWVEHGAANY